MSTHKKIDVICCMAVIAALLITVVFMNAEALGIQAADRVMGYEDRLFDETTVHTIDIVIDDWDSFLATCQSEEYSVCNVLIDGEAYTNVGIRGKGNTSLSTVSSMDSDRYSFKIEFDQYDSTKSYYGLDKLCLNNVIQDNTYMKDFLVYQMMEEFGVDAPLCSYVYITVNGEDWGLYLAVEGVEDSFLQRNYGSDYGELYKPDSMSMGGGRGNGREFNVEDIDFSQFEGFENFGGISEAEGNTEENPWDNMPQGGEMPEDMQDKSGSTTDFSDRRKNMGANMGGGAGGFGMGSDDVKLQYIDDDPSSYSNIFDSAKTDLSEADQERLIASLKALSEGEDISSVVDIEEVIRYFVVHNFVVNGDSYTGSMIHNYYLYEEDGQMSMIPWDYNLAFGTFQSSNAESAVNDPIDSPVSGGSEDRPMIHWIFESEEYTELYHEYFAEFLEQFFENNKLVELIDSTAELIAPYVEKDPTKFCTYEEFETGVETIREFCLLRAESVSGQLSGIIPSTSEGQTADNSTLIEASGLNLSDMGTMNMGGGKGNFGGGFGGGAEPDMGGNDKGNFGGGSFEDRGNMGNRENGGTQDEMPSDAESGGVPQMPEGMEIPETGNMQMPEGMEIPEMGNMQMPTEGNAQSSDSAGAQQNFDKMNISQGDAPSRTGEFNPSGNSENSMVQPVLLAGSLVCLLAGLLVAFKYKR